MNLVRRSGAPSAFACILGLALGATCATMTACSAASGSSGGGGWLSQSGGGPLGGGTNDESSSGASSSGGQSSGASPTSGAGDATAVNPDATAGGGEGGAGDDGGLTLSVEGGSDAVADAPGEAAPTTADFTLINASVTGIIDGSPVAGFDPIAEGAAINLAVVGSALSIRANTVPALVGSVGFALDATYTHTENTAPYFLCSDDGKGDITSCASVLTVGKHSLSATPFSGAGLTGDAGAPILLDFTIVDVADGGTDGAVKDAAGQ
jgi:hypothetical protein